MERQKTKTERHWKYKIYDKSCCYRNIQPHYPTTRARLGTGSPNVAFSHRLVAVVTRCFHTRDHVHTCGLKIKAHLLRAVMRRHAASVSLRLHYRKQQPLITQPALTARTFRSLCNMLTTATAADRQTSTLVDPVNATLSTPTCEAMAAPAVGPYPGKILTTPGGNPACQNNIGGNNL